MAFEWLTRILGIGDPEERASFVSGDSALISQLLNSEAFLAQGGDANVLQTAAVEFGLNEIARAFMAAEVTPAIPSIGPSMLASIARQTLSLRQCSLFNRDRRRWSLGIGSCCYV